MTLPNAGVAVSVAGGRAGAWEVLVVEVVLNAALLDDPLVDGTELVEPVVNIAGTVAGAVVAAVPLPVVVVSAGRLRYETASSPELWLQAASPATSARAATREAKRRKELKTGPPCWKRTNRKLAPKQS